MAAILEETSTITAKGQTTIPKSVRRALGVDYGGKIAFRVDELGVSIHRADLQGDDPVLGAFLDFLARDIECRPDAIKSFSPALTARIAALTEGVNVDPDEEIHGEVDL